MGLPIGAGEPDLVLVDFGPELRGLARLTPKHVRVLAFLAEAWEGNARDPSGASLRLSEDIEETLDDLTEVGALAGAGSSRTLTKEWQQILKNTVAIEAKVSDWRRGAAQATRNRIFAERSYLALPPRTAERIAFDPLIDEYGIGVLAVAPAGCVTIVREAPRQRPLIWFYYFSLAVAVAASLRRSRRGL